MKSFQVSSSDRSLMDMITYTNPTELKALIKYALTTDNIAGDETTICILADLKTILGLYESEDLRILTPKQKVVILEHLVNDRTQVEVAGALNITQQGVSILLNSALRRIKNYIQDGKLSWVPWSEEDRQKLLREYGKVNTLKLSKELKRPPGKVISMYHYLKNK